MNDEELEQQLRSFFRDEIPATETAPSTLAETFKRVPHAASRPVRRPGQVRRWTLLAVAAVLSTAIFGGGLLAGAGLLRVSSVATPSPAASSPEPTTLLSSPSTAPTATAAAAEAPLGGGWIIAFDPAIQAGAVGVYQVDARSGDRTLLGTLPWGGELSGTHIEDWLLQWSADHTRVLIYRFLSGQLSRTLDATTDAGRNLTFICCIPPTEGWAPILSPGGHNVAVGDGVYVGKFEPDSFTRLALPVGAEVGPYPPAWSPDETALVIAGCLPCANPGDPPTPPYHRFLWVLPIDGSPARALLDDTQALFGSPAWSPDGSTIAMSRMACVPGDVPPATCEGPNSIAAVSVATGELVTILSGPSGEQWGGPIWSPDGRRIAVQKGSTGIVVMDPDGGNQVEVVSGPIELMSLPELGPKWSPDGRWLLFIRDGDLWIVGADGSGQRRVGTYLGADW
jgi:hypothetical protein